MQPTADIETATSGRKRRTVEAHFLRPPSLAAVNEWFETFEEGDRRSFLTVTGRPTDRTEFYARLGLPYSQPTWLAQGPLGHFQYAVEQAWIDEEAKEFMPSWWPVPTASWGLLWGLVAVPDFQVEEPLREMVDRSVSVFHTFFLALWEIRFFLDETMDLKTAGRYIEALGAWAQGQPLDAQKVRDLTQLGVTRRLSSDGEKLDVMCFLLALASQNGLISKCLVVFDNIEQGDRGKLKELGTLLETCNRWTKIPGMALGLLLGWDGQAAHLGRANLKLANLMTQGVP